MINIEKIRQLNLEEMITLRNEIDKQKIRLFAGFDNIPTEEFRNISSLLERVNLEILNKIQNEYLE